MDSMEDVAKSPYSGRNLKTSKPPNLYYPFSIKGALIIAIIRLKIRYHAEKLDG